jgi:S1-C subfamily serine protease
MRIASLAVPVVCALLAVACGGEPAATRTVTVSESARTPAGRPGRLESLPELVDRIQPSIVTVFVRTPRGEGSGSGVVWNARGIIVTNHHVVAEATQIDVQLASGARMRARVQATDPLYDLAVLRVSRDGLPVPRFAARLPEVGEVALALGSPLGLGSSVTSGIVSALHRSIPAGGQAPALVDLIQTDAAISPGNSGGALVNAAGEVIGINVAYLPPEASAVSIGFAIPAPTVVEDVRELIATGNVEHAFLGIEPAPVTPEIALRFDLPVREGAIVIGVGAGSAAANARLRVGDVIVQFGRRRVRTVEDLYTALRSYDPGDRAALTVWRDIRKLKVDVTLDGCTVG